MAEFTVGPVPPMEAGPFSQVKDFVSLVGSPFGLVGKAPKIAAAAPGVIKAARAKAQADALRGGLPREELLFGP